MRHILIIFMFVTTNTFAQFYSKIKDNSNSDKNHKDKPAFVEIDTAIIKDLNTVIVYYNSELIKREGNRFYLSSKPFTTQSSSISISLNEKGNADFSKYLAKQKNKKRNTTEEFNRIHENDYFKIQAPDTLLLNVDYEAFLEIDTNKIKNLNTISVLFYDLPINRIGNKYKIAYKPIGIGPLDYEIRIIKKEKKLSDTIKFTHSFFVTRPKNTNTFEAKNNDYVITAQIMPKFNSKNYKSFDDYFIQSLKRENIILKGKIFISYTVMINGTTRFEMVRRGEVNDNHKDKIKTIIESYSGWTSGEDNGKQVNVMISPVYNFQ